MMKGTQCLSFFFPKSQLGSRTLRYAAFVSRVSLFLFLYFFFSRTRCTILASASAPDRTVLNGFGGEIQKFMAILLISKGAACRLCCHVCISH